MSYEQLLELEEKIGVVTKGVLDFVSSVTTLFEYDASNYPKNKEPLCLICQGEYEAGEEVRGLPCSHDFHRLFVKILFLN